MTARILAACSPGEIRVAVIQDGMLCDYAIWRPGAPDGVGDVYRGRVVAKVAAMAGAFVALGASAGFLPDSEGAARLGAGDLVTVRVTRAPQGGKGPRLTASVPQSAGLAPALQERGPGPLLELASHYPEAEVVADDAGLAARLRSELGNRLHLVAAAFDPVIEEQVQELASHDVYVPAGVALHIHPTPALVAIDVDGGATIGSPQSKVSAHLAANRAALPELARQIRLRNLSGAILVDFAGLPVRRRPGLGPDLQAALADDPLRPRLLGFTALGLAEIVRKRVHPPLHELLAGSHAAGLAAMRRVVTEVAQQPHRAPTLRASPAVIAAIEADKEAMADLARLTGRSLILRSDANLQGNAWTIDG